MMHSDSFPAAAVLARLRATVMYTLKGGMAACPVSAGLSAQPLVAPQACIQ